MKQMKTLRYAKKWKDSDFQTQARAGQKKNSNQRDIFKLDSVQIVFEKKNKRIKEREREWGNKFLEGK